MPYLQRHAPALGLILLLGSSHAFAQGRPIRFFFSTIGLSDPADVSSPALNPYPDFEINPHLNIQPNTPTPRLYIWAQITPPGTPNNATYNGIHILTNVTGAGGSVSGFQFWNYTNGSYGNGTGRWQNFTRSPTGTTNGVSFAAAAVTTGAGVNNTAAAQTNDAQYRRFAPDGTTRIDATLLGWVQFTGSQPGQQAEVRLAVGSSGIAQSGQPVQRVYFGWGDDGVGFQIILGNCVNCMSEIPDATFFVIPEPAALGLFVIAGLALLRVHSSTRRPTN